MRRVIEMYYKSFMCSVWGRSLRSGVDVAELYKKSNRVPLSSIDMNGHMTNSHYHAFMDYVHVFFMMDTGIWEYAFHDQGNPMVSAAFIRFRRSLNWRDDYEVQFKVKAIDEAWFYSEFQFIKDGFVHCQALRKFGVHKKTKGMVDPAQMLQDLGQSKISTDLPEHIKLWKHAEDNFKIRGLTPGV